MQRGSYDLFLLNHNNDELLPNIILQPSQYFSFTSLQNYIYLRKCCWKFPELITWSAIFAEFSNPSLYLNLFQIYLAEGHGKGRHSPSWLQGRTQFYIKHITERKILAMVHYTFVDIWEKPEDWFLFYLLFICIRSWV